MSTQPTSISQFSVSPSRTDIANFDTEKYQFLSELSSITTEVNSQASVSNSNETVQGFPSSLPFLLTVKQQYSIAESGGSTTLTLDTSYTQPTSLFRPYSNVTLIPLEYTGTGGLNNPIEAILLTISSTSISVITTGGGQSSINGNTAIVVVPGGTPTLNSIKPTSSSSAGLQGQSTFDSNYLYFCIADNTWRRIPLSTY